MHKQLQRIKSYLTKNNIFCAEDVAAIAKGEDPGKNEVEDETPSKKKSRRVSVNALRIVIKNSQIFEQTETARLADSASQAILVNEELVELCSDLTPIDDDIVTAAGDVMGMIKFKRYICFMGVRIECLVANINTSIVSSGKTAVENKFSWTFGPGEFASVTSHDNNVTVPFKLVDKLYPLSKNLFTATVEEFIFFTAPTVLSCKPCTGHPISSSRTTKENPVLGELEKLFPNYIRPQNPRIET